MIAGAAGGVVGGYLSKIAALIGRRRALHCALLGVAVSNALLALVPSVLIVALALFLEMFAALLWNVVTVSYRQRFIPDALLRRDHLQYCSTGLFGCRLMMNDGLPVCGCSAESCVI